MSQLAMNITIRQNRSLLTSKKEKFKGNNREAIYASRNKRKNLLEFKKTSKKELNKIKENIRIRSEKVLKRELIYYGILFIIATIILTLLL